MLEHLSEKFVSLAKEIMQVSKELKKTNKRIQTNFMRGKMSQKKSKNGDDKDMMQYNVIAIQYIDDNGSKKVYQPKGYLSHRPKEKRWMGRFRKIDRKEKCVYAKTKKECKLLLDQTIEEYCTSLQKILSNNQNLNQNNDNLTRYSTLNAWFEYWLNTFKKPEIKESTYNQYVEIYNRYTYENVGYKRVCDLEADDLQKHLNSIEAKSGLKKIYQIFRDLFYFLHEQNTLKVNPMKFVVLPKRDLDKVIDKEEKDEILLYKDEAHLLEYLSRGEKKNKYYYIIKFGLYSGLRRGELLGLQWKHIDIENETISVRQQFDIRERKITSVKTNAAIRTVPLLPQTKEVLLELYNNQSPDEFIFNDHYGITQRMSDFSRKLGFRVNPHMLRHTFTSRSYTAGLDPKRIQQMIGHETVDITLNTYTHVLEKDDLEIIQMMRDFYIEKGLILKLD